MADGLLEDNSASAQARAERLRFLREKVLRISRAEMEQITAISEASIENWEYARYSGLTERGAKRVDDACRKIGVNCTAKWLLFGIGKSPGTSILQPTSNEQFNNLTGLTQEEIIAEELQLFYQLNKNAVDIVIQDDSMLPFYQPGDRVAGIQHFDLDIEKAVGKFCIIKTLMGEVSVNLLKKGTEQGYYSLSCTNQNNVSSTGKKDNIKLFSAAPILWLRCKSQL